MRSGTFAPALDAAWRRGPAAAADRDRARRRTRADRPTGRGPARHSTGYTQRPGRPRPAAADPPAPGDRRRRHGGADLRARPGRVAASAGAACGAGAVKASHVVDGVGIAGRRRAAAVAWAGRPPTPTSTGPRTSSPTSSPGCAAAAGPGRSPDWPACWSPCRAASTPPWPPRSSSRPATTSPGSTSSSRTSRSTSRSPARAAARSTTRRTRVARRRCSTSRSTSGTWPTCSCARCRTRSPRPTRGHDAQPVRHLQREGQVRGAARAGHGLGFDALATGHHARLRDPTGRRYDADGRGAAAPRGRPAQGPDLRAVHGDARTSSHGRCPGRGADQGRGPRARRNARSAGRRQARHLRRLLHPRRRHRRLPGRAPAGRDPARSSTSTGASSARTTAIWRFTIGQRRGLGSAPTSGGSSSTSSPTEPRRRRSAGGAGLPVARARRPVLDDVDGPPGTSTSSPSRSAPTAAAAGPTRRRPRRRVAGARGGAAVRRRRGQAAVLYDERALPRRRAHRGGPAPRPARGRRGADRRARAGRTPAPRSPA